MNVKSYIKLPLVFTEFAFQVKNTKHNFATKTKIFRILISLYLKKSRKSYNNEVSHNILGYKVYAYSYKTLFYLFQEIFISEDYFFKTDSTEPKIIDCGSNIGMAILYFKRLYPNSHITAFEPNPHAFKLLKKNVEENNLKDVKIFNSGLSSENGTLAFYLGDDKGGLTGSLVYGRGGTNVLEVNTIKLSETIIKENYDFIKMDVEGAENDIVKDIYENNCLNNSSQYVIEYHHNIDNEKGRLLQFLEKFEKNGFSYNLKTDYNKTGFQDILFHFYKN